MKAINLLPPDQRGTPKGTSPKAKAAAATDEPGGMGAFVVLGALALCVVAIAAYVLTNNTVKDRRAQRDAAAAEAQAVTQRVSQLKPYADFKQMAETRIQTVKDLASSRFDWEQALRDVSRAIPADVTLSSMVGSIASGAGGGSPIRDQIEAPAIELNGCTNGQTRVAALLSRLRNVDGVTRVSLAKSAKPAKGDASAAVSSTSDSTATPCGEGRKPAFELVMFFERSTVPDSVADITVQTAGAGASTTAAGGATPATEATATPTPTPQGEGAK